MELTFDLKLEEGLDEKGEFIRQLFVDNNVDGWVEENEDDWIVKEFLDERADVLSNHIHGLFTEWANNIGTKNNKGGIDMKNITKEHISQFAKIYFIGGQGTKKDEEFEDYIQNHPDMCWAFFEAIVNEDDEEFDRLLEKS